MNRLEKLEKLVKSSAKTRELCTAISIITLLAALASIGQAISLALLIIGLIAIITGSLAKRSQKEYRRNIYLEWKASIDHTPGSETHQCNACFGPVFVDAERCRHCGGSFVDEGVTIIPFIGVGF